MYGQGPTSLAAELKIGQDQATQLIRLFKEKFPGVNKFLQSVVEGCRETKTVTTLLGRIRYLPAISSNDEKERLKAERQVSQFLPHFFSSISFFLTC